VLIYKNDKNFEIEYKRMLTAVVFLYKTWFKKESSKNGGFYKSRVIEKLINESYRIRKTRVKIKNVKLGITKWWDNSRPLSKEMVDDGWEYGQYFDDEMMKRRKRASSDRIWIWKTGFPDKMVSHMKIQEYLDCGWNLGRNNLPSGFREKIGKIAKENKKMRGNMKGRMWIHNPVTNKQKAILKTEQIPENELKQARKMLKLLIQGGIL
jgi:hypothetical protein